MHAAVMVLHQYTLNKDRILKAVREKGQVTYKGRPDRITPDFSPETMKDRRAWIDVIQTLREHKYQPRLLYQAKLSITIDGETKVFHDKNQIHTLSFHESSPSKDNNRKKKNQYKRGTFLHCWWACRLVQPLWKSVWRFLRKLDIVLPEDPAIHLLGIYSEVFQPVRRTHAPLCS